MKRWRVTWGDQTSTVYGETEADAWTAFAGEGSHASRHPHHFDREIVEIPMDDDEIEN